MGTPKEFFKRLTDGGVDVLEFNPVNPLTAKKGWEVNQRDHRKLLIVDGRTAFVGGINISSVYSGGSFSSASQAAPRRRTRPGATPTCRSTGPVVAEFQKLFLATWEKQKGDALAPGDFFPAPVERGQGGRARHRQLARRAVQPDLRDAALGDRQRRDQRAPDQRLLRSGPATARRAQGCRGARRGRDGSSCRAPPISGWSSTPGVPTTTNCCAAA